MNTKETNYRPFNKISDISRNWNVETLTQWMKLSQ